MKTSETRILTTHVGSLPRGQALSDLLVAKANGRPYNEGVLARAVEAAVDTVVDKQISAGIDIVNDGEMPRTDFVSYITERMTGFGRGPGATRPVPMDAKTFPVWFDQINQSGRRRINVYDFPQAIG